MNEQEFRELSAARALHALSVDEEQRFSSAFAQHPEWHQIVREDQDTAAALAEASDGIEPPPSARASLLDLISNSPQFGAAKESNQTPEAAETESGVGDAVRESAPALETGEDQPASAPADPARGRRRVAGWFALAASVAVLLTGALVFPWGQLSEPKDPVTMALQQVESASDAEVAGAELPDGSTAALHWSAKVQLAVFVTEGMPGAPADRDYELWIVRGDRPISVGVVRVDGKGAAAILAPGFMPGDAIAVTVEDRGGSPTGAPTTDPIMVIATT